MALTPILLTLFGTLAVSAVLTPIVRRIANRRGWLAHPAVDRWHRRPVALLGGYAMGLSFAIGIAVTTPAGRVLPLLLGSGLMFALGALDDIFHFRASTKLVVQTIIAGLVLFLAPSVTITGQPVVDLLLALTWIVGVTNAFNLLDNMDGLSAGIAAMGGGFYLLVLASVEPSALALAIAVFIGAALGFLIYNFQPASIFMGDSGSLFLGSFLAVAAILAAPELQSRLAPVAAIPLFILLIPIFDTAFVTITRRLAGRSPMIGGRDHVSHRLVALGIGERSAVLALYALAALGGALAVTLLHVDFGYASILLAAYLILLAGLGIVLGHVEAHAAEQTPLARAPFVADVAYRNRIYEVLLDVALLSLAYYAAFRFRFDGPEFTHFLPYFAASLPIVIGCQLAGLALAGKYRQLWRSFGPRELFSLLKGISFGVAGSVLLMLYLYRFVGYSRAVFAIDAILLALLLIGVRAGITSADQYLRRQRGRGRPVLIFGAGRGAALLVRELLENRELGLMPIGFVDDDPVKRRLKLEGLPVLGRMDDLPAIFAGRPVSEVLVSIRHLDRGRLGALAAICREHGVPVRAMRFALEEIGPVPHLRTGSHAS